MPDPLRGNPNGLQATVPKKLPKYGNREDGTPKGIGYFGEIARSDDPEMFSTELSVTVGLRDAAGNDRLIPLIVPTLTAEEIAHLVDGGSPTREIVKKAYDHAKERLKMGKSPYAADGEVHPLPLSGQQELEKGFHE